MAAPVLFIDHASALGGAEVALLSLFETLDRARFTPHLATQPGRLAVEARALGVAVHEVPLARLRKSSAALWRLARGVHALRRVILAEEIALVHSNSMRSSFYAAAAARLTRRPLVWHVQDVFTPGPYVRTMCALSAAVVAISKAVAAPLPCGEKIRVIPLGVLADQYAGDLCAEASRVRAEWGVPRDALLIGQIARLQPWKGQRDVIAAAGLLGDLGDVYVAIVGGDIFGDARAYEGEIAARARAVGDRVILAGHRDDVPAVLQAIDILVHASDAEPFGRILIEAGAAGVPIVAYASGAVAEILVHDDTGLLVPAGDKTALAAALRRLVGDAALRRRLGGRARVAVRERFDIALQTRTMEEVFERSLRTRSL